MDNTELTRIQSAHFRVGAPATFLSTTHHTTFGDDETCEVAAMHDKFGFDVAATPHITALWQERAEKMNEELIEFMEAGNAGDLPEMADALVDLVVFAKGTAVMMGIPWATLWNDVMRANMAKESGEAPNRPGHKQDMIKPEGWEPPRTEEIIALFALSTDADSEPTAA